jgi:two-component system nitrate/nitrite response regulator NarL
MTIDRLTPAFPPIRVLLVDDHQTVLWGLERLVNGEHPLMEVAGIAFTCEQAIVEATQLVPDVILLDLDLGGTSSVDILPRLLANGISRALVLTGERRTDILDAAIRSGARGILSKEAPADVVVRAIEKTHSGQLWLDHESLGRIFGSMLDSNAPRKRDPEREKQAALTSREVDIVAAIVELSGAANKTVAQRLFISEHTLRNHLTSIYYKLGLKSRLDLYVYAVKHRLAGASHPSRALH